jgi:hypothetical protein
MMIAAGLLHAAVFPLSPTSSWYFARHDGPIGNLWSGAVERCIAAGVTPPHLVEDIYLSDGRTQSVVSVGALAVTNTVHLARLHRVTNQIGPYVWTYSDLGSSVTATSAMPVTRALLDEIDLAIARAIPSYADPTNKPTFDNMSPWPNYLPAPFGSAYLPQLMLDADIGLVTNIATNAIGIAVSGDSYFTRSPLYESRVRLAIARTTGDVWTASYPDTLPRYTW